MFNKKPITSNTASIEGDSEIPVTVDDINMEANITDTTKAG